MDITVLTGVADLNLVPDIQSFDMMPDYDKEVLLFNGTVHDKADHRVYK